MTIEKRFFFIFIKQARGKLNAPPAARHSGADPDLEDGGRQRSQNSPNCMMEISKAVRSWGTPSTSF